MPPTPILPDVLQPGLRLVFCGTAPGTASAAARAYYAGPGNAFWQTLYAAELTPELLAPEEFAPLPEFGIGLTDLCKVRHGSDAEVGTVEFDVDGLRQRIAEAEPEIIAFNGKNAAGGALEMPVQFGPQEEQFGGAAVWVLPSTSGAARRYWDLEPWQRLAAALRASAQPRALPRSGSSPGQRPVNLATPLRERVVGDSLWRPGRSRPPGPAPAAVSRSAPRGCRARADPRRRSPPRPFRSPFWRASRRSAR